MAKNKLTSAAISLIMKDPYYGLFSRHFKFIESSSIAVAGVRYRNNSLEFVYNPNFILGLSDDLLETLIRHEVLHPSLGHLENFGKWDDSWNIAADLAINSHLPKAHVLAMNGCYPGGPSFEDFPAGKSMEYYEPLVRKMSKERRGGNQAGLLDDHLESDALSSDGKDLINKIISDTLRDVKNNNLWGSVPIELRAQITAYLYGKYDWSKHLARIVGRTRCSDILFTRRKKNKRFPGMFPGSIRQYRPRIVVGVDESGSVSNDMWTAFAGKIGSLSKYASFTYVPFDSQVHASGIRDFNVGERFKIGRRATGGTNFSSITRWFNERSREYDALCILTDGEAEAPNACKKKRFWILPDGCKFNFSNSEETVYI